MKRLTILTLALTLAVGLACGPAWGDEPARAPTTWRDAGAVKGIKTVKIRVFFGPPTAGLTEFHHPGIEQAMIEFLAGTGFEVVKDGPAQATLEFLFDTRQINPLFIVGHASLNCVVNGRIVWSSGGVIAFPVARLQHMFVSGATYFLKHFAADVTGHIHHEAPETRV